MALAVLTGGGCAATRYAELPETPHRPHRFAEQTRRRVELDVYGVPAKLGVSYIEAGSGEPLVLVHGLMTSAYSWRYVIPELARRYRVIVPDLPGAGQSDAPAELAMSPISVAAVLASFTTAVGAEKAYVVGNSLGGYLCTWYALLYPQRVRRLMVMHAPGFPELRLRALKLALGLPFGAWMLRRATSEPEEFVIKNVHYRDGTLMSKEEAREYGAIFKDPARARVFYRVLLESMDPSEMARFVATLKERGLKVPARLLWSRDDVPVPPANGPRYQALIPEAELVWVDGSSHFLQVDSPDRTVEEILRFDG